MDRSDRPLPRRHACGQFASGTRAVRRLVLGDARSGEETWQRTTYEQRRRKACSSFSAGVADRSCSFVGRGMASLDPVPAAGLARAADLEVVESLEPSATTPTRAATASGGVSKPSSWDPSVVDGTLAGYDPCPVSETFSANAARDRRPLRPGHAAERRRTSLRRCPTTSARPAHLRAKRAQALSKQQPENLDVHGRLLRQERPPDARGPGHACVSIAPCRNPAAASALQAARRRLDGSSPWRLTLASGSRPARARHLRHRRPRGKPQQLLTSAGRDDFSPAWSPDGRANGLPAAAERRGRRPRRTRASSSKPRNLTQEPRDRRLMTRP